MIHAGTKKGNRIPTNYDKIGSFLKGHVSMFKRNIERVWWNATTVAMIAVVAAAANGCGRGGAGLPEGATGTVSGKVTYDGKAIPAGSAIVFVNEKYGIPATGTIAADGQYQLQMRGTPEILAGEYKIGVTPPVSSDSQAEDEEAMKALMEGKATPAADPPPFPERYFAPETSGVVFQLKEGPNTFDLDMKDNGAE